MKKKKIAMKDSPPRLSAKDTLDNQKFIYEFCVRHTLSKNQLADMIGVTSNAVDHWYSGRRDVPYSTRKMMAICDKYPGLVAEMVAMKNINHAPTA